MTLDSLRLAEDWHKLRLQGKDSFIYVNMKTEQFSLAPVLSLDQLQLVLVSDPNFRKFRKQTTSR